MVVEIHIGTCYRHRYLDKLGTMKTKLAYKIFLAFFLTAVLIVALLIGMQYYSIRNFVEYVNLVELGKLESLEARLITIYSQNGDWEPLQNNRRGWHDLLEKAGIEMHPPPFPPHARRGPPGPPGSRPAEEDHARGPGPFRHPPPPPPREPPDSLDIGLRLALFDADKSLVVGPPRHPMEEFTLKPVKSGSQIIGWLGLHRMQHRSDPFAAVFLERQSKFFYLAGVTALILAGLVTVMLSRQILSPVKALAEGTQALSSRQFDKRISVRSKDELGQLAEAFNSMSGILERYETMQQQWISDISHELRTPLAVLRAEIEALQDGIRKADAESLSSLHTEVIRIGKLVDDLHLLSLADSQDLALKKSKLDPIRVLSETVALFQNRMDERGLHLDLDIEESTTAEMQGDPDRLKQVFSNILDNTLRHADVPGKLRIRSHSTGQGLTIRFEDSGPGVPPESLARLFDRLYRVDCSRSRQSGGSGLGLAICRQIVEAHGGRIEAEHSTLGGLSIRITLNA